MLQLRVYIAAIWLIEAIWRLIGGYLDAIWRLRLPESSQALIGAQRTEVDVCPRSAHRLVERACASVRDQRLDEGD